MAYKGTLASENADDIWLAAITQSFCEYNLPDPSPELQLEFIGTLEEYQRHALVCWLLECEVPSGGIHGLLSSAGLLLPEIEKALEYYDVDLYLQALDPLFVNLEIQNYPRNYEKMMDRWEMFVSKSGGVIEDVQSKYWELAETDRLGKYVEKHIQNNFDCYFENA